jgi:putative tryptophan/tyrosine transport system substrate-binding protein
MHFDQLKRRDFVTLLGGAAAWPLAARAQQPEWMRRIGVLMAQAADDPEGHARITAFAQGLQEAGWTTGRNVGIDYRWAGASADAMAKYAAELVGLAPDVILAATSRSVAELQRITRTIRRDFITLLGGVAAWPVAANAQFVGDTVYREATARPDVELAGHPQGEPRERRLCRPLVT